MSEAKTISEKTIAAHGRLVDAFAQLNIKGVTILTGSNGSGKSVVRRHVSGKFRDQYKKTQDEIRGWVLSTSMDDRTGTKLEMMALSGMMRDTEWIATSQNTYDNIRGIFNAARQTKEAKYLMIDEFEIGCSEETIAALATYIHENLQEMIAEKIIQGALIITHSRKAVELIQHDHFINLDGYDEQGWLTRTIVPTNLEELERNELFSYLRDNNKKED